MKSRSNLESFEIFRISAGSLTAIMSVIPGKYVRFMVWAIRRTSGAEAQIKTNRLSQR